MRRSCEGFACVECGGSMEQVEGVPVLQSLQGHVVHRCDACGHILLVQEDPREGRSAGWLTPQLMELKPGITCLAMV
jgi:DNA-directed RNA polymerase subunit RPC12/RpoP